MASKFFFYLSLTLSLLVQSVISRMDYDVALTKSLLYFEAQRSGKLPTTQRVQWRGDSALQDGSEAGVDLVGGYYDAGDNVKFGFPMAYTITMLSWGVIQFRSQLEAKNELHNALDAIKWGTYYLIKAHTEPNVLYAEVGDGDSDHTCWERPEDMTTPRTVHRIDEQNPGSDLAGETAAALAAASIVFDGMYEGYSTQLLNHAKELFDFANNVQGKYSDSIPVAREFYSSSGFEDELLWAAAWLFEATNQTEFRDFLTQSSGAGGTRSMFSWDDKYVGAQVIVSKNITQGRAGRGEWATDKSDAEQYICNCIQKGNSHVPMTPGGMLWFNTWANLQYVTSASLVLVVYADYLRNAGQALKCPDALVNPDDLIAFARSQVEYILGNNPRDISYMVGFGSNFPQQPHHRGASIVSIKKDPTTVGCQYGFTNWFNRNQPNPNVVDGAIVGGPDRNENYNDARGNFEQAEPATATVAPFVGVLARIASN